MNPISFNSSKQIKPSIKRRIIRDTAWVSKEVDSGIELAQKQYDTPPMPFYGYQKKKYFVGRSVSVVKINTKLDMRGAYCAPIKFYGVKVHSKLADVSFTRPKPFIIPASKPMKFEVEENMINPYEKKVVEVILGEKPTEEGFSGSFELEFSMLRNETRTFKLPFKYLATLEDNNGGTVLGEYLTFTPEEIGEYHFRGQGGFMKIKVSPALTMNEVNLNI